MRHQRSITVLINKTITCIEQKMVLSDDGDRFKNGDPQIDLTTGR